MLLNRKARAAYRQEPAELDAAHGDIVQAIRQRGIDVHALADLGHGAVAEELVSGRDYLLRSPLVVKQIERGGSATSKDYVIRCLGERPELDLTSPFARLALDDQILGIANAYLGMFSRLIYVDVWLNLPVPDTREPVASQQWHRDYDDRHVVKLFVYLVDVDERMGPFTYVQRSQPGARFASLFRRLPHQPYPDMAAASSAVPQDEVFRCIGPAGTAVFADTAGLHQGGRSISEPRVLFTAFYASDAAFSPVQYTVASGQDLSGLSKAARYAIGIEG